MIAFGTAVTDPGLYERCAARGIERVAEPDSAVFIQQSAGSLFATYNVMLDRAKAHDDLEALVLLHQDAELVDADFAPTLRAALEDPDVAIVGCAGAIGVRSIAWWQGSLTWAGLGHRYEEFGGGEFPAISWRPEGVPPYASTGEVDCIDGFVMALSPWAVHNLRFDESLGKLHGYDFDICMQAKAAGKKVATADFRAIHHHSLDLVADPENWIQTHIRLAEKWQAQLPDTGADPVQRALRAEADAACARVLMVSHQLRARAIERQLKRIKQELDEARRDLQATRGELQAARRRQKAPAGPPRPAAPGGGKLAAIDYAVEELGIESFASLERGQAYGQYAFYAIAKDGVERGALIEVGATRAGDFLLSAIEQAAEKPGIEILDGDFADPETIRKVGRVDAVFLYDVLLRLVAPDWDEVLELYAPVTSAFVIANPQWEGDETVRLPELGRERFLEVVPPWPSHRRLFDRLDEWDAAESRRLRDTSQAWQWGITDADLEAKLSALGFAMVREWRLNRPPQSSGFVNKAFVFRRAATAKPPPGSANGG